MSDLCAARDPKEQEELRCQVLSGYAIICQEAGATPASWRDHTHCGEALTCPSSWPLTPSALSTPCSSLGLHGCPHLGFLSWFPRAYSPPCQRPPDGTPSLPSPPSPRPPPFCQGPPLILLMS